MLKQKRLIVSQLYDHKGFDEALTDLRNGGQKNLFLDVTAIIRSLQRVEGNPDCFGKATGNCDKLYCLWRDYCLGRNR